MVGRLLRSTDFERVLAVSPRARSAHFALHHLADGPSAPERTVKQAARQAARQAADQAVPTELSTGDALSCPPLVDDLPQAVPVAGPAGWWLGTVVPKRHAKRSVTRNLIKRQIRALMVEQAHRLPAGLWVLRLKAPFDPRQFPSAASAALRLSARVELGTLFERARSGEPAPPRRGARA